MARKRTRFDDIEEVLMERRLDPESHRQVTLEFGKAFPAELREEVESIRGRKLDIDMTAEEVLEMMLKQERERQKRKGKKPGIELF